MACGATTGLIDFDQVGGAGAASTSPRIIIAGGSAYPRIIDFARFREIADSVGAIFMVDMAHFAGLVAAGVHPSPLRHAHVVTTTTHKTLRGPRGGMILTNDADIAKRVNSAIFPGLQGGPLMHIIAAKAVAFGEALQPVLYAIRTKRSCKRQGDGRGYHRRQAMVSSPAAPTRICCWWICARRG